MENTKIRKFVNNCLEDKTKYQSKLNKNYYFISTLFFIMLNIIIYAIFHSDLATKFQVGVQSWDDTLNFKGFFSSIINNISHWSWSHVLLNMFPTFLVISVFLERKFGSFKHFLIVLLSIIVSATFVSGNHQSLNYVGWSCVNFSLFGFFVISYFFSLIIHENTNGNLIYSTITFIAVFIFSWWKIWKFIDNSSSAADLIHNMGHYSGFLAGIVMGLTIYLTKLFIKKSQPSINDGDVFCVSKTVKIICVTLSVALCIISIVGMIFIR